METPLETESEQIFINTYDIPKISHLPSKKVLEKIQLS